MKKIIIIGGGISGLAAAWYLHQNSLEPLHITLIEKSACLGGLVKTHQDSFPCELGPRGFMSSGKGLRTLHLCEQLGLKDELIQATPHFKKRFLYIDGALQALPTTPLSFLGSKLMRPHLISLWKEAKVPAFNGEESILDFFSRRFSSSFAHSFIDPFVSGIFAGNISELSINACFPSLKQMEYEYGSIVKGFLKKKKIARSSLFSFKLGMETLIHKLYEKLKGNVTFLFEKKIDSIEIKGESIEVHSRNQKLLADFVIIATDPHNLLKDLPTLLLPKANLATLHFGFNQKYPHQGFGYLVPSKERESILGATWDSQIFSRATEQSHLCVMMGGRNQPEIILGNDQRLIHLAFSSIQKHLGIKQKPSFIFLNRCLNAVPQYTLGHNIYIEQLRRKIQEKSPRIFLTGNYLSGVGINDCINESYKTTQSLLEQINRYD